MSKQHKIRWGRSDYSKLSHLVRKVNQKTFGLEVKRPDLAGHIPEQLDYQELKSTIKTRSDFNRVMKKYNRFLQEGSEELVKSSRGAVASKWEVHEFEIAQRVENMRRAKRKKYLEGQQVTIANKPTGVTRAEMGKIKENEVKESKKKFNNMSQREWEVAFKLFDKKLNSSYVLEKKQLMIRNYMKGLVREGYSDELLEMLNTIPLDKFVDLVDTDETATFDFIYDPIELRARQEQLLDLWREHSTGENINNINIYNLKEETYNEIFNGVKL